MNGIVRDAAAGDPAAWRALVERYNGMLFAIGRRYRLSPEHIEDVVQDTWLQLVRHVSDMREPDRLGAWLATTMQRGCLLSLQRRDREMPYGNWNRWQLADARHDVEAQLLEREQEDLLWGAVRKLPPRQRDVLRALAVLESYADVGAHLGIPVGAIGPTRARALRRLRLHLSAERIGTGVPVAC